MPIKYHHQGAFNLFKKAEVKLAGEYLYIISSFIDELSKPPLGLRLQDCVECFKSGFDSGLFTALDLSINA